MLLNMDEFREVLVERGSRGEETFLSDGLESRKSLRCMSLSLITSRVL